MSKIKALLSGLLCLFVGVSQATAADETQLAVWVNEAIVATYTYSARDYVDKQREIAKYFTAAGWTSYTTALNASGLPDAVKENAYAVSAVALAPPLLTVSDDGQSWKASMPLLVVYKNPQQQQKQTLQVSISFTRASNGTGVRGFAINSLKAQVTTAPCQCKPDVPKTSDAAQPANADQSGTVKAK